MTNEQINQAVAEELGWYVDGLGDGCIKGPGLPIEDLPDFCTDYNAVAEMRNGIKEGECGLFTKYLRIIVRKYHMAFAWEEDWLLVATTPRQQAEAFLRMRGKWREG